MSALRVITIEPEPPGFGPHEITVTRTAGGTIVLAVEDNSSVAIVEMPREKVDELREALA